jgi:hypothetical protein
MKTKISILVFGLLILVPPACRGAGTTSALFLRQEPTARVTGMGGASAALYDDAGALYLNPAGLGWASGHRLAVSAWRGVDEKSREAFVSDVYSLGRPGVVTLNYLYRSSGKEDIYDLGGDLSNVELAREYAVGAGWGHSLLENFSVGVQGKFLKSELAEAYDDTAVTVDAGVLARTNNGRFSAGAGIRNAVGELKYISDADPLPRVLYGGAAMKLPTGAKGSLVLAADVQQPKDEATPDLHAGLEYGISMVALRLGVKRVSKESSFTIGGGLNVKFLSVDYGFQAAGDLKQPVHKFTLNLKFDGLTGGGETAEAPAAMPAPETAPGTEMPDMGEVPAPSETPVMPEPQVMPETPAMPEQRTMPETPAMPQ